MHYTSFFVIIFSLLPYRLLQPPIVPGLTTLRIRNTISEPRISDPEAPTGCLNFEPERHYAIALSDMIMYLPSKVMGGLSPLGEELRRRVFDIEQDNPNGFVPLHRYLTDRINLHRGCLL
ncbi:hypothetical protein AFLA_008691 [Aspergillus flavus NRRL3357]|nr:hypothetical protein AFLA_008691 [Aspergillus flavus NRRL3357]